MELCFYVLKNKCIIPFKPLSHRFIAPADVHITIIFFLNFANANTTLSCPL